MTQDPRQYQGPSPYPGPDPAVLAYGQFPGIDPYGTLRTPARRAGWTMIATGALTLLCGLCTSVVMSAVINPPTGPEWAAFNLQRQQLLTQITANGQTPQGWQTMGVIILVFGVVLLAFGIAVRQGGKLIVRIALGLNIVVAVLAGLAFLRALIVIIGSHQFQALPALIVLAIPVAVFGLLVMLLLEANKNAPLLAAVREQFQQQLGQYQQQQRMYLQAAASQEYGVPPSAFQPPPPPPACATK